MSDALKMPRSVDDPPILLLWSADELGAFFACFLVGFFIQQVLVMLVIGYFLIRMMRRFQNTKPRAHMIHLMYWWGVPFAETRTLPNPYDRSFKR